MDSINTAGLFIRIITLIRILNDTREIRTIISKYKTVH